MAFVSFKHHKDLPLDKDSSAKFLPWLIAFMVYLAALAVVATALVQSVSGRWESGVNNTLTIQIPPAETVAQDQKHIEDILKLLREHPAISHAETIAKDEVLQLMAPWLGNTDLLTEMPIPHLVDARIDERQPLDAQVLVNELHQIAPGTTVDDHRVWLRRLIEVSQALKAGAYLILILILLVSAATIFFVTRTGLAIHRDVIEVLHLIGAQDTYIARQFAEHALSLALRGGFFGLAFAVPTFGAFAYLYNRVESTLLPSLNIGFLEWLVILLLPFLAAGMGYITARHTVLRSLKKMV